MRLAGRRAVVLVDDGYQELEFWIPWATLQIEGAEVHSVGVRADHRCRGREGLEAPVELAALDVDPEQVDALVVPGGWAPDRLRRSSAVVELTRRVFERGALVAMIGHGGLVGISAGIVRGRRVTGSSGIKDDLINAGAVWTGEEAVSDGHLVSGRTLTAVIPFTRLVVQALLGSPPR